MNEIENIELVFLTLEDYHELKTVMIHIADVDIDMLRELHQFGSVRNLKNQRKDIYQIIKKIN